MRETTEVLLSGPNNGQLFCNSCGSAVCRDEKTCPGCKRIVIPEDYNSRWRLAFNASKKNRWCTGGLYK